MTHGRLTRLAVSAAALCGATLVPAGAAASVSSIKAVIESYSPKIEVAEGRVLTAIGEYSESTGPAGVESAISGSVGVLGSLKENVAAQPAGSRRGRRAKAKIESGLQAVIVGYGDLSEAYAERTENRQASVSEAASAVALVRKAQKDLAEGVKLLS
jgi:hypothetical protein